MALAQELKGTSGTRYHCPPRPSTAASAPLGWHELGVTEEGTFEQCGSPLLTFPSTGGLEPSAWNASPPLGPWRPPSISPAGGGCGHVWGRGAKGFREFVLLWVGKVSLAPWGRSLEGAAEALHPPPPPPASASPQTRPPPTPLKSA